MAVICDVWISFGPAFAPAELHQIYQLFGDITVTNGFFDDLKELSRTKVYYPIMDYGS
jgi:hypothetical protein